MLITAQRNVVETFAFVIYYCRHITDVEERQEIVSRLGWMLVFNPLEVCFSALSLFVCGL